MPSQIDQFGVEVYDDMAEGLKDADVVMMLRLQRERMDGGFIPSEREYYHRFGLDAQKLAHAKEDAIVMHPGPMNRGVEIDGTIADDINRSVIQEQVEMGVAVRIERGLRLKWCKSTSKANGRIFWTLAKKSSGRDALSWASFSNQNIWRARYLAFSSRALR
jgi:hypothetical protein